MNAIDAHIQYVILTDKVFDRHVPDFLGLLMVGADHAWRRCSRSARKAVCAPLLNRGVGLRLETYQDGTQLGVMFDLRTKQALPHPWYRRGNPVSIVDARDTF